MPGRTWANYRELTTEYHKEKTFNILSLKWPNYDLSLSMGWNLNPISYTSLGEVELIWAVFESIALDLEREFLKKFKFSFWKKQ